MYCWMSVTAVGTEEGSLQVLIEYGPETLMVLACTEHPSEELTNATNFFAASSFAPVVDFGM